MKEVLGGGSCWKKVINSFRSGQVPDNASSITLPMGTTVKHGFTLCLHTSGAVFGAFKREHVPLDDGVSPWLLSQVVALFYIIMRTCMKDSSIMIPFFVSGKNGVHPHDYDRDPIEEQTMKNTYHRYKLS